MIKQTMIKKMKKTDLLNQLQQQFDECIRLNSIYINNQKISTSIDEEIKWSKKAHKKIMKAFEIQNTINTINKLDNE